MNVLSQREMQVAELLAWGYTDKEISFQLYISFDTVRSHHHNIYNKTGCKNLSDITRWYFEQTSNYHFGIRPALRNFLVGVFLMLSIGIELYHMDCIRTKTTRTVEARVPKAPRSNKQRNQKTILYS